MFANIEKLVASVHKTLSIVQADSPLYFAMPLWVQRGIQKPSKHSLFMNKQNVQSVMIGHSPKSLLNSIKLKKVHKEARLFL